MPVDLSRVTSYHLCQDDFGLWFIVAEHDDGELAVVHHADQVGFARGDAERLAARDGAGLVVEEPHVHEPLPAEEYVPPKPRRARA